MVSSRFSPRGNLVCWPLYVVRMLDGYGCLIQGTLNVIGEFKYFGGAAALLRESVLPIETFYGIEFSFGV